jgi:ABC-type amino acid transport substrate-binding protein
MLRARWRTLGLALWVLMACAMAQATSSTTITYPRPESNTDLRYVYYWRLMEEALNRTKPEYGPFVLQQTPFSMNALRCMEKLLDGSIQVALRSVMPPEFSDRLDMVPVPLDKGLLGYRVFLIHKDSQAKLAQVSTVDDLRAFRIGQGLGWDDLAILAQARMQLVQGTSYDGLFQMLELKRFDLFPRGINEVQAEYRQHRSTEPDLAIDDALLLFYPLSRYFAVKKGPEGDALKARLVLGLARLRADGGMDKMYAEFKKEVLRGLPLKGRKLIRIDNPSYTLPIYGLDKKEYWDTLSSELKP